MHKNSLEKPLSFWLRPTNLILIVAVLSLVRLAMGMNVDLVEDEAYYRLWGLYPALGYYDHPPMVAYWIWMGQALFGDTTLGVRFISILSAAIGSLALWRTAKILYDVHVAGWTVLFFNASLLIGVGSLLATPDAPAVFFWGLSLWAMAELSVSKNANWWLAVGIFAGLGLISKYSVLFLGAGIVLWVLWVPQNRRYVLSWQLWLGGALALAIFSPVLYWNAQHEWISFVKQFGRSVPEGYSFKYIGEFIGAVAGLLNPLVFVIALVGAWNAIRQTLKQDNSASLLVLTVLPFLIYLFFHSLHSRVQGNWPAPIYPTLAMFAGIAAAHPPVNVGRWFRALGPAAVVLGVALAAVVYIHAYTPLYTSLGRKDPTHQMRSWQQIGDEVAEVAHQNHINWVATSSYGLTGQMANALKNTDLTVYAVPERMRYAMIPDNLQTPEKDDMLYVAEERRDQSQKLKSHFEHVELLKTISRESKGVFGKTSIENVRIYRLSGGKKPLKSQ
ncbi:Undecaprenyl phosphate-alpha-4-amino-4-deoxy-L-arabinose arabinosyl transferase [Pseudovibrio axinellae]|uniref:Undecaprenyl phosphate-alpha-4-amino-4-deoxy-L-arabinose arabinosyl transferase n=1 Tax=Pseudovibrio axinellae TaxID=989403 RepID=A0A165T663_9HYPH|nr:glycosyltransferase family 39 protein [Pseudovibrio axinellae]KZL05493.1 Undecaprenyl phosphate-alpha-4-amino-4-deoxy-L-arabinose arabinosyl transferase [Pseudovibrio axinellae]SEP96885.1 Dolichyl-phosphate-mannose-protein mannosyltransferase [Pseudovibrio axinellae]